MNLLQLIADMIEAPDGAYDRLIGYGVPTQVIDGILALQRDDLAITLIRKGSKSSLEFIG